MKYMAYIMRHITEVFPDIDHIIAPREMQPERWQAIPDTEGLYEASTYGNIRSHKTSTTGRKGELLKSSRDSGRYLTVKLYTRQHPRGRTFRVHDLILRTFAGPRPEGLVICHWDDNPENNHWGNLRYDTRENNRIDGMFNRNPETLRTDPITSIMWWCPVKQRWEIDL